MAPIKIVYLSLHWAFSSWDKQELIVVASFVVEHGFRSSLACGIFLDQDQAHVPCIGRWTLSHGITRDVLR